MSLHSLPDATCTDSFACRLSSGSGYAAPPETCVKLPFGGVSLPTFGQTGARNRPSSSPPPHPTRLSDGERRLSVALRTCTDLGACLPWCRQVPRCDTITNTRAPPRTLRAPKRGICTTDSSISRFGSVDRAPYCPNRASSSIATASRLCVLWVRRVQRVVGLFNLARVRLVERLGASDNGGFFTC